MAQEEIYIKLIQGEKVAPEEIPKEFLSDFQFCKIALEKNRIDKFSEKQQREMSLQAVEAHLHSLGFIHFKYDISDMARILPENVFGELSLYQSLIKELPQLKSVGSSLHLSCSQVQELPQLKSVGGDANLRDSQIQELPKLESVGEGLDLRYSKIEKLPQLKLIGNFLDLFNSKIKELPQLTSVGGSLYMRNSKIKELPQLTSVGEGIIVDKKSFQYWKDYFTQANRPHLVEKVTH